MLFFLFYIYRKLYFKEGHSSEVTDVCWHSEEKSTLFYSCSKDRFVIEWDHNLPKQYVDK